LPVIFDPVDINGSPYIDGGILDNLPIVPLKKNCDFIIAMHCNPIEKNYMVNNWKELMERSLLMAISSATYLNKKKCDLFWEPPEVARYKVFDFKKAREIYEVGYNFAKSQLKNSRIDKLLSSV